MTKFASISGARAALAACVMAASAAVSFAAEALSVQPGFDSASLGDSAGHAAQADIGFTVQMGALKFDSLYVHLNGVVTFGDDRLGLAPRSIPRGGQTPILAPFWVDVDSRLRENVTYGQGMVGGASAFGVTWRDMTPFGRNARRGVLNTFQLLLVDRSAAAGVGAFDIYYLYEELTFDQSMSSRRRRGAARDQRYATAGGDLGMGGGPGTYFELLGSGMAGAMLAGGMNPLVDRPLAPTASIRLNQGMAGLMSSAPPIPAPVPPSLAFMAATIGFGALARRLRRRV